MGMWKWLIGILVAAAVLTVATIVSSRGGHETYDTEYFRPGPTLGLVKALSSDELEGRATGSVGNTRARELIAERMDRIGLRKVGGDWFHPFDANTFAERGFPAGVNIMGFIRGKGASSDVIVITAHYDHLGVRDGEIYNGADDNASGVAAMLAVAENFMRNQPEHDMYFIAFDAEEQGFGGAISFMSDPPVPVERMALNVNLDMVSRGDNGILWAAGTFHTPSLKPIVESVAEAAPEPVSLQMGFDRPDIEGQDDWTRLSDHRVFHERAIPFIYLGVEDHPDYHQPTDDFDKIDQDFYLAAVDTAIMLVAEADARLGEIGE
jgi:hypothetical protein